MSSEHCYADMSFEKELACGEFVCTHCNNAGPLSECPERRNIGFVCPRCGYCVHVLSEKEKP